MYENIDDSGIFSEIDQLIEGNPLEVNRHVSNGLVSLERAPNPIVFVESSDFLGIEDPLFPFQFEVLRDYFELLCPICNDTKRIKIHNDVPRDEQVLFEHDVCPACNFYKYDAPDYWSFYNELVGCGGMRGSKSVIAAEIAHWITHLALTTDNLHEKFGIQKTTTIDAAFIAVSAEQAEETVWDHYVNMYKDSPWYQHYAKELRSIEKLQDNSYQLGDLINDRASNYINFGEKNIRLKSLHSNSATLVGKTRLYAVVDEMSRFDTGESKRSALEVYRAMKRSLATLMAANNRLREQDIYDLPDAHMISVSSPIFSTDRTMKLLDEARNQPRMYSFHKPTWEMNPNITKKDLDPEFQRDPTGAERDYAANPPGAENPFIKDPDVIKAATDIDRRSMFDLKEEFFDVKHEKTGMIFRYLKMIITNMRWRNLLEYGIHCDPGESGDSFCIGIGHKEEGICIIDGAIEIRPIPKNNPQGLEPRKVHFPSVTELLLSISETLSILAITYDKWNSTDQIQRLIDRGILAVGKNLTRDDHVDFYNNLRNGKVRLPNKEAENLDPETIRNIPCSKALFELEHLNDNGSKVDHPPNGSNDVIQTYVGVHRLLMTPEKVVGVKIVKEAMYKQPIYRGKAGSIGRVIRLRR